MRLRRGELNFYIEKYQVESTKLGIMPSFVRSIIQLYESAHVSELGSYSHQDQFKLMLILTKYIPSGNSQRPSEKLYQGLYFRLKINCYERREYLFFRSYFVLQSAGLMDEDIFNEMLNGYLLSDRSILFIQNIMEHNQTNGQGLIKSCFYVSDARHIDSVVKLKVEFYRAACFEDDINNLLSLWDDISGFDDHDGLWQCLSEAMRKIKDFSRSWSSIVMHLKEKNYFKVNNLKCSLLFLSHGYNIKEITDFLDISALDIDKDIVKCLSTWIGKREYFLEDLSLVVTVLQKQKYMSVENIDTLFSFLDRVTVDPVLMNFFKFKMYHAYPVELREIPEIICYKANHVRFYSERDSSHYMLNNEEDDGRDCYDDGRDCHYELTISFKSEPNEYDYEVMEVEFNHARGRKYYQRALMSYLCIYLAMRNVEEFSTLDSRSIERTECFRSYAELYGETFLNDNRFGMLGCITHRYRDISCKVEEFKQEFLMLTANLIVSNTYTPKIVEQNGGLFIHGGYFSRLPFPVFFVLSCYQLDKKREMRHVLKETILQEPSFLIAMLNSDERDIVYFAWDLYFRYILPTIFLWQADKWFENTLKIFQGFIEKIEYEHWHKYFHKNRLMFINEEIVPEIKENEMIEKACDICNDDDIPQISRDVVYVVSEHYHHSFRKERYPFWQVKVGEISEEKIMIGHEKFIPRMLSGLI